MRRQGFTLVELLLTMAIMGILVLLLGSFFVSRFKATDHRTTVWEMVDAVRRAQTHAMNGLGNNSWGVHFESAQYVLFKGSSYNLSDPENIAFPLANLLSVSVISLNGGGSDVIFSKASGTTTQYGTITVLNSNDSTTKSIFINAAGRVNYQ
ncbi:MAG: type II secretion system protein [Parcubacteria group bacterium]|nr:type II secretion system protein [Parcubacteria group bacterium]